MLIYAIYNDGKTLFDCEADIVTYKRQIEKVKYVLLLYRLNIWYLCTLSVG